MSQFINSPVAADNKMLKVPEAETAAGQKKAYMT